MRRVLGILTLLLSILSFAGCDVVTGVIQEHGDATSTNALLQELTLSEGTWEYDFNMHDTEYAVSVADEVDSITVKPKSDHLFATITVNGDDVDSGSNSLDIELINRITMVTIVVTAWDGITQKTYTLTVNRLLSAVTSITTFAITDPVDVTLENNGNRTYSAVVGTDVDTVRFSIASSHPEADIELRLSHNGILDLSNDVILNSGLNSFLLKITAEDGSTIEYYTAEITKLSGDVTDCKVNALAIEKTTLSPEFDSDDHNGAPSYAFTSQISAGKLSDGGDVTTNLVLTTNSGIAKTTITTPLGDTEYLEGGQIKHKLNQSEFPADDDPYNIVVTVESQDTSNSVTYNIALTVRAGNNDASLISGDGIMLNWGANNSRTVLYPGTFATHDPRNYGFAAGTANYIAVMYATETAKVTCQATDSNASSITINGVVGTPDSEGRVSNDVSLSVGYVTDVNIEVKAEDNSTTKNYTVRIRALNVHEFYWGIYGPLNSASYERWYAFKESFPLGVVNGHIGDTTTSDNVSQVNGYLFWQATTSPTTYMRWKNYNDGNYDQTSYSGTTYYIRTDYNYNHPTNPELDGFVIGDGETFGDLDTISNRDGYVYGGFTLDSPWGDRISEVMVHYWVDDQDKAVCHASWVEMLYLGEVQKIMYMGDDGPYPFTDPTFDWETPWVPVGYPLIGYPLVGDDIPSDWSWHRQYDSPPSEQNPPDGCPN